MKYLFLLFLPSALSLCGRVTRPTPAPSPVCVYYCAAEVGFLINEVLYRDNISWSFHGFWTSKLGSPIPPVSYDEFVRFMSLDNVYNLTNFYDLTTLKPVLGCGHYRNYKKHGARSGFTFASWYYHVDECLENYVKTKHFVHQCSYNGTHNSVLSVSSVQLELVGCVSGAPFNSLC